MKRVAILGMGLMGASLAGALRTRGLATVAAYARREATRREALQGGWADSVHASAAEAVKGSEIVVLCTPVLSFVELLQQCRSALESGAIITDVGSTKGEVVREAKAVLGGLPVHFIGSHPMTGSDRSGLTAARVDLYNDALVALTPTPGDSAPCVRKLAAFWEGVGARTLVIDAAEHDRLVARTSHLPHVMAAVLAHSVGRDITPNVIEFCGPGFRDTTRVAAGSPDMWHDIVKSNLAPLRDEVRIFKDALAQLESFLDRNDFDSVRRLLEEARDRRLRLGNGKNPVDKSGNSPGECSV